MLKDITPVVLTYNEEANIGRTLSALQWADRVVVVDSFSDDATLDIVSSFPNARLVHRQFERHADQWNFATRDTDIKTEWVLALDADYLVTEELQAELAALAPDDNCHGFTASFIYCIDGKPLRGTLYPDAVILFRRASARYIQSGHTQRLDLIGPVGRLHAKLLHDDRKSLARWLVSQQKYASLEAAHLLATPEAELRRNDRIRKRAWLAPILVFFYTLIVKRCILDGRVGWYYVMQRTLAEFMIALNLLDRKLRSGGR